MRGQRTGAGGAAGAGLTFEEAVLGARPRDVGDAGGEEVVGVDEVERAGQLDGELVVEVVGRGRGALGRRWSHGGRRCVCVRVAGVVDAEDDGEDKEDWICQHVVLVAYYLR